MGERRDHRNEGYMGGTRVAIPVIAAGLAVAVAFGALVPRERHDNSNSDMNPGDKQPTVSTTVEATPAPQPEANPQLVELTRLGRTGLFRTNDDLRYLESNAATYNNDPRAHCETTLAPNSREVTLKIDGKVSEKYKIESGMTPDGSGSVGTVTRQRGSNESPDKWGQLSVRTATPALAGSGNDPNAFSSFTQDSTLSKLIVYETEINRLNMYTFSDDGNVSSFSTVDVGHRTIEEASQLKGTVHQVDQAAYEQAVTELQKFAY